MRIALIGTGNIAGALRRALDARGLEPVAALCRGDATAAWADLAVRDLDALCAADPDLVVECAGHAAVAAFVPSLLERGIDCVVASSGALADAALETRLRTRRSGGRLWIPAGALAGIDAIAAASRDTLARVALVSTKPPRGWGTEAAARTILFQGNARAAAKAWPKNANVAATLALAGIGFDATEVTLVADPAARGNTHRIEAEGAFGQLRIEIEGAVSADNPRTSHLTALSILRAIEQQTSLVIL
jgi:aspartate dehydrogenase